MALGVGWGHKKEKKTFYKCLYRKIYKDLLFRTHREKFTWKLPDIVQISSLLNSRLPKVGWGAMIDESILHKIIMITYM
jgi:hypothetical protein